MSDPHPNPWILRRAHELATSGETPVQAGYAEREAWCEWQRKSAHGKQQALLSVFPDGTPEKRIVMLENKVNAFKAGLERALLDAQYLAGEIESLRDTERRMVEVLQIVQETLRLVRPSVKLASVAEQEEVDRVIVAVETLLNPEMISVPALEPEMEPRCACASPDAYACWRIRYPETGPEADEVEADGGPCMCDCHEDEDAY